MKRYLVPPTATSWLPVPDDSPFPIQNIPFALANHKNRGEGLVAAIGDHALDLPLLMEANLLDEEDFGWLDSFLGLDPQRLSDLRKRIAHLLDAQTPDLRDNKKLRDKALLPIAKLDLLVPIPPTSFVDFYSGIHHASNVGKMFRPDQPPLLPNYRHLPVGYNGRSSSVVPAHHPVTRPKGQTKAPDAELPTFGPTLELDFELELGYYIGEGSDLAKRVTVKSAEDHVLGLVLVNDWSARDIQRWEYQPLGPFLSKSFATSVSPWLVTLDALEPARIQGMPQEPEVLPHLRRQGLEHFDITLEVHLQSPKMTRPQKISESNTRHLYWSIAQQIAHQTSNGTPLEFGDLYASGTISGPEPGQEGSLLELTWKGTRPLTLTETGETRTFLEDGDTLTLSAHATLPTGQKIGFGTLPTKILPAK